MAISSTSVMVTWDMVPPIDQNGDITMYEVLYQPLETFSNTLQSLTVNTPVTVILTNLQEYVEYNISVRAYTSEGEGPCSTDIIERTFEDGKLTFGTSRYTTLGSVSQERCVSLLCMVKCCSNIKLLLTAGSHFHFSPIFLL